MNWMMIIGLLGALVAGGVIGYMQRTGKTFLQIAGRFVFAAIMAAALWVVSTLAGWVGLYQRIYSALEESGWAPDRYLLMAMTGLLTGVAFVVIPMLVASIFSFRKRRFIVMLTGVYCGACLLLFVLAKPQPGQVANVKTGESYENCFKSSDGVISKFSSVNRFHPHLPNTPLITCTAQMIMEYDVQQASMKNGSPLVMIPFKPDQNYASSQFGALNLWLEQIQTNNRNTLLYLACAGRTGGPFSGAGFLEPTNTAKFIPYLTDQNGNVYKLLEDRAEYPQEERSESGKTMRVSMYRPILVGEYYRFIFVFPTVPSSTKVLTLHDAQFGELGWHINPPQDRNANLLSIIGESKMRWFPFAVSPEKVVSESALGGELGKGLELSVKHIGTNDSAIIVTALATAGNETKCLFSTLAGADRTYLQDDTGFTYHLEGDMGEYGKEEAGPLFREISHSAYPFELVFKPALREKAKLLTLHHWQFPPIQINLNLEETRANPAAATTASSPSDPQAVNVAEPNIPASIPSVPIAESVYAASPPNPPARAQLIAMYPTTHPAVAPTPIPVNGKLDVTVLGDRAWSIEFPSDMAWHGVPVDFPAGSLIAVRIMGDSGANPYSGGVFVRFGDSEPHLIGKTGATQFLRDTEGVRLFVRGDEGGRSIGGYRLTINIVR